MFVCYFTEQPYTAHRDADAGVRHEFDHPARALGANILLHSNRFFDPVVGAQLYRERLVEYQAVEEAGFDGIMLNEHHNGPLCMQPRCNIMAAMLAVATKRVKLVQLGNPLPLWENPVQLAEETSMIDMVSGGRLVAGIVRGGGTEQLANNVNPAFNRDRFQEAHDLLVKAWTEPGPWRWEGEHYQFRVVNPWSTPLQKPHPRVFVPGTASKETVEWSARQGYPFVSLSTTVEQTKMIWKLYDQVAAEQGYEAGPPYRGYLMKCQVAETEAKAVAQAREFMWMSGEFAGNAHPVWTTPAGYSSWEARKARIPTGPIPSREAMFEKQRATNTIVAGDPDQVVASIARWLEETRPSMLMMWMNDGRMNHEESLAAIRLFGKEVLPRIKAIGDELGLSDPFQAGTPVSVRARQGAAAPALVG